MQPDLPIIYPNLYELSARNLHITYSTTGVDGQPHFSYQGFTADAQLQWRSNPSCRG